MLSFEEKYDALVRKDSSYEGIFVTAVKTTGRSRVMAAAWQEKNG